MVSQESEFKSILDQQELEFNKRVQTQKYLCNQAMDEMMVEFQKIIEQSSNKLKLKEQECLNLAEKTVNLKEIVEGSIVEKDNLKLEID